MATTQSLLYEDRLLAVDTPETLKECFSLSKSLREKGIFSWYSYINHVRTKNKMDLGNQDMKKNSLIVKIITTRTRRLVLITVEHVARPPT